MEMRYLLDTSAILDTWRFYPHRAFLGFWENFVQLIESDRCFSIDEVDRELKKWPDDEEDIKEHPTYIMKRRNDFFIKPSNEVLSFFQSKLEVEYRDSPRIIKNKPFADPLLIAEAGVNEYFLITSERLRGKSIPAVCERLKSIGIIIECGGLNTLIEREGWIF